MRLVITSVNYGDMLRYVLPAWARFVPRWSIVVATSGADKESQQVSAEHGVRTYVTETWFREGAQLRKGAALNEAFDGVQKGELCISADADVVPFGALPLDPDLYDRGTIYGAPRFHCPNPQTLLAHELGEVPRQRLGLLSKGSDQKPVLRYTEDQVWEYAQLCLGYFQLFKAAPERRFGEGFMTAGGYDGEFRKRFRSRGVVRSLHFLHLGGRAKANWASRVLPRW